MAVATWVGGDGTGSEQTDYGRAANWSGGVVPDADDHVIVANTGHNCKLDANREAASLTVNSGATLDGSGAKLSIKSEGDSSEGTDGYAVNLDGAIAGNLDLEINTPAATNIDLKPSPATHFVRNVTINHASCAAAIADGFMTITGNLTITAGSLNTGGNDLTVAGATSITGTLTCNASTVSLGSGKTDAFAVVVNASGTFNGGSGTHTYGSLNVNSSAALFAFSSGTTTLDGKSNTERIFSTSATNRITAAGTLNIATSQTPVEIRCDDDTAINNLTMNSSSKILHLINHRGSGNSNPLVIGGDLTVTAGTVSTRNVGDSLDYGLTVTGDVLLPSGGTLTGNSSTLTFGHITLNGGTLNAPDSSGSLIVTGPPKSGWLFNRTSGTFNHNNGLVHIQAGTNSGHLRIDCYDLKIEMHGSNRVLWRDQSGNEMTVANDLTIVQGGFDRNDLTDNLTVTGNVVIEDGGKIGDQNGSGVETGDNTFGSLKVESGGIYDATSGTTSLNAAGQGHSGNPSAMEIVSGGTFVHNNGTIKLNGITDQDIEMDGTGNFYNLTLDKTNNDVIMHPNVTIENNLDITLASDHTLRPASTSNTVTVLNQTILRAGKIGATTAYDANHNWGTLTILGGTFNVGSGTNEVTAIRNVGGTIS